jgi:hypothetical protein
MQMACFEGLRRVSTRCNEIVVMDERALYWIARQLAGAGTRRKWLRFVAFLPLAGPLDLLLGRDGAEAKKKHKRRHKKKHRKKCGKAGAKPVKGKCCAGSVTVDGICQTCDVCASGCEFKSVQDAIAAAAPGATIAICPGTYRENLSIAQDVRLVGAGDGEESGNTIVQGTGETVAISGGHVVIEHLRITAVGSENSVGLFNFLSDGTTELVGCSVSEIDGLAGIVNDGALTLTGCTVRGNRNTVSNSGGGIINVGTLSLTDCIVVGNDVAGVGGGIANTGSLTLTRSEVSGNTALYSGGGIINDGSDGAATLTLIDSRINGNTAGTDGGGIWNGSFATTTLDADSRVTGNTADGDGGGIFNPVGGTVTLVSSKIVTGNRPNNCGDPSTVALCSG